MFSICAGENSVQFRKYARADLSRYPRDVARSRCFRASAYQCSPKNSTNSCMMAPTMTLSGFAARPPSIKSLSVEAAEKRLLDSSSKHSFRTAFSAELPALSCLLFSKTRMGGEPEPLVADVACSVRSRSCLAADRRRSAQPRICSTICGELERTTGSAAAASSIEHLTAVMNLSKYTQPRSSAGIMLMRPKGQRHISTERVSPTTPRSATCSSEVTSCPSTARTRSKSAQSRGRGPPTKELDRPRTPLAALLKASICRRAPRLALLLKPPRRLPPLRCVATAASGSTPTIWIQSPTSANSAPLSSSACTMYSSPSWSTISSSKSKWITRSARKYKWCMHSNAALNWSIS
mmetsp:Transcript_51722/g.166502  ORF Transcript_51722/g.166502 Transcript_51722/m.166502 type:complete len:350 (+) Transcript_51722:1500-2549(+)